MIKILVHNEIDRKEWSALIQASATGTWFQTLKAYEFFASMPELFRPFALGLENEGKLRGVCVGFVTREQSRWKQHFMRRAIILGGPCLADDVSSKEVEFLMNRVKELMDERVKDSPIYIETRNFNDYSKWKGAFEKAGFEYKKHLNFHVDCEDEEAMWERLSENRKRQIKKAYGVPVMGDGLREEDIRDWYGILVKLYRTKVKTPLWPQEFFLEAYRQGVGKFLLVKHDGKVIGGSMVVTNGKCMYEWFECGLNAEYKEQYPSVLATWGGMQLAHEMDCKRYDMMGAGEPSVPYGVRDFKSEFGGTMVEHGRFLCVSKPLLYKIGKLGVNMLKML